MNQPLLLLSLALLGTAALTADEPADLAGARVLFEAHRFPEAQQAFERLLAIDPANADVHYYLGRLALERRDTGTAVRELERAVALAPGSASSHSALGEAYGRSAEKAWIFSRFMLARECLAEFKRAVALEPGNVDYHERLFEYYCRAPSIVGGGSDKAAGEAATIEKLDPVRGHQAYATLLAALDEALNTAPEDYALLYRAGHMAAVSGQHLDRGLASLRHCLKLAAPIGAPPHSAAQWCVGNILEEQGDHAGARVAFDAALKLDPNFTPASDALRNLDAERSPPSNMPP